MKGKIISSLLIAFMSLNNFKAYAYDIAVRNADGVTIYYNYINDGKELEVTAATFKYLHPDGTVSEDRSSYLFKYSESYTSSKRIVIPSDVVYMGRTRKVTGIDRDTFVSLRYKGKDYGKKNISYIYIPSTINRIGQDAFSLPEIYKYEETEAACWAGAQNIDTVVIENLGKWLNIDFANELANPVNIDSKVILGDETELTNVTIPEGVTNIRPYVFNNFSGIRTLTIPNSVTSIGKYAFNNCKGLTSVTIPNSVTSIGNSAFAGCKGLTSVTIPNSVTSIGNYAFYNCEGLTSVTIPNSVTSIGRGCFASVDLTTVVSLISNPFGIVGKDSGSPAFSRDTFYNATLYVPKGTIDKYKSTEGWKDFVWIEEGTATSISNVKQEVPSINKYYNLEGIESSQSRYGINIIKMNDGTVKKVMVK